MKVMQARCGRLQCGRLRAVHAEAAPKARWAPRGHRYLRSLHKVLRDPVPVDNVCALAREVQLNKWCVLYVPDCVLQAVTGLTQAA